MSLEGSSPSGFALHSILTGGIVLIACMLLSRILEPEKLLILAITIAGIGAAISMIEFFKILSSIPTPGARNAVSGIDEHER